MTGNEFTIINGVRVLTSSIEWAEAAGARPDGSRGVMLKNGVFALIPKGQQNKNAQLSAEEPGPKNATLTLAYNLNKVEFSGSNKDDSIWLTNCSDCEIDTKDDTSPGLSRRYIKPKDASSDDVHLVYDNKDHGRNSIISDCNDNLTITERYDGVHERTLGGNLNGRY